MLKILTQMSPQVKAQVKAQPALKPQSSIDWGALEWLDFDERSSQFNRDLFNFEATFMCWIINAQIHVWPSNINHRWNSEMDNRFCRTSSKMGRLWTSVKGLTNLSAGDAKNLRLALP